jgi:glycosyltransferase involved in cell wall biosynthesis
VVSRVDPIKRVDLLLDMLDQHPSLRQLHYDVFGTGWDLESLRERAGTQHPMVRFHGFSDRIPEAIARSDLLLHLCPEEPFGLAILEAMAARVPVLVPDRGGASTLVEPDISGVRFSANDLADLAVHLQALHQMPASGLNRLAEAGYQRVRSHYSSSVRLNDYRQLIADLTP